MTKWKIVFIILIGFGAVSTPGMAFGQEESPLNHPYQSPAALQDDAIVHVPTGVPVTAGQLMDTIAAARVIYVGETHDNIEAHRVQLEIISRLVAQKPGKVAVGMEMFRHSAQGEIDRWLEGEISEKDFRILFRKNWGPSYALYQPIFDLIKSRGVPLLALKSSREMEDLFRTGEPAPWPARFPDIDEGDAFHRAQAMAIFGGHQDDAKNLEKPYRMLLLWEETMAETVADFVRRNEGEDWTLVVLAGGFHVQYGFGIPKRAFRRNPHAYSIVLPTITEVPDDLKDREMKVEAVSIPLYSADFIWKVPYTVARPNRLRLGVRLTENDSGEILISSVMPSSLAEKAGVQKDDVILRFDGEAMESVDDLIESLNMHKPGDRVTLSLRRGSEEITLPVVLTLPK
jgi:uncharacterized iron-regulated protein